MDELEINSQIEKYILSNLKIELAKQTKIDREYLSKTHKEYLPNSKSKLYIYNLFYKFL